MGANYQDAPYFAAALFCPCILGAAADEFMFYRTFALHMQAFAQISARSRLRIRPGGRVQAERDWAAACRSTDLTKKWGVRNLAAGDDYYQTVAAKLGWLSRLWHEQIAAPLIASQAALLRRPAASKSSGIPCRSALQGSFFASVAGLLADGGQLMEECVVEGDKLSHAGIMLRACQVVEFDEAYLRRAARLTEEQAAKEGSNLLSWQQLSNSVGSLLEITELEGLAGCTKAADELRDIKQIADMGKGKLSPAEFQSIADKYAQVRQELEVAFKALPSELRTAGQLEMQKLLSKEEEILIAEEERLLQLEGVQ